MDVAGQRLRLLHKLSFIATCVNAGFMEKKDCDKLKAKGEQKLK